MVIFCYVIYILYIDHITNILYDICTKFQPSIMFGCVKKMGQCEGVKNEVSVKNRPIFLIKFKWYLLVHGSSNTTLLGLKRQGTLLIEHYVTTIFRGKYKITELYIIVCFYYNKYICIYFFSPLEILYLPHTSKAFLRRRVDCIHPAYRQISLSVQVGGLYLCFIICFKWTALILM